MNRAQFQKLAEIRIREAEALCAAQLYDGAYYLAGYAVEFGLKACIAKRTRRHDFPDRDFLRGAYTHDFAVLLKTAELVGRLEIDKNRDQRFAVNWVTVRLWSEESRYSRRTQTEARNLVEAITDISHGVLPWIKQFW